MRFSYRLQASSSFCYISFYTRQSVYYTFVFHLISFSSLSGVYNNTSSGSGDVSRAEFKSTVKSCGFLFSFSCWRILSLSFFIFQFEKKKKKKILFVITKRSLAGEMLLASPHLQGRCACSWERWGRIQQQQQQEAMNLHSCMNVISTLFCK
jgi:hypothetical protein